LFILATKYSYILADYDKFIDIEDSAYVITKGPIVCPEDTQSREKEQTESKPKQLKIDDDSDDDHSDGNGYIIKQNGNS